MLILSVILIQIFIFIGLIYGFRHILTKNVSSATRHLEELNQDYTKKDRDVMKRLEETKRKSEEILSKASGEAEKQKAQILKQAEQESHKVVKEARIQSEEIIQQADRSRKMLISELEDRIAKEAVNKACELIQDALPERFKQDAHSHWIKDLIKDGFNELERLSVSEENQEVKIISAFPLSKEERKDLTAKLKTLLKRDIVLKEEVDPKIIVGIIVSIGSLVLDGSLRDKIQKQANSAENM
ncbi:F0F1 ATP synthase subunit delta [Candidatus Omnitrophota bacterium]